MAQFGMMDLLTTIPAVDPPEISLNYCGKSVKLDNADDAGELSEAIDKCDGLQSLNLKGNSLGVEASVVIGNALKKKPQLKKALFSDLFTGRTKTEIPKALINLSEGMMVAQAYLSVLDLSDNAMGPIGAEGVVALLKGRVCERLQELHLNNNGLGTQGAKMIMSSAPTSLTTIVMGRNRLENEGAIAMGEFLMSFGPNQGLKTLSIPQNGIYHKGVAALARGLGEKHTRLQTLNLNDNTVGPKGAAALSEVFPKMAQLEDVNLGDCLLKSKGALHIAKAIDGQLMAKLDLSYNEIGPKAQESLTSLAQRIPTLTLRLGGNRLGEKSKTALKTLAEIDWGSDGEDNDDDDDDEEDAEEEEEEHSETESEADEQNSADESKNDTCQGNTAVSNGSYNGSPMKPPAIPSQSPLRSILKKPVSSPDIAPPDGTVSSFLSNPSGINFKALGGSPLEAINKHCQNFHQRDLEFVDEYVAIVMCVAGLRETAVVRSLLEELFTWSKSATGRQWALANAVLSHMTLMKSETARKANWDLDGCLLTISELIEESFFSPNLRDTIRFFAKLRAEKQATHVDALLAKYPKLLQASE